MPNEQKPIPTVSTGGTSANQSDRRRGVADGALTMTIWTLSGIVLAACTSTTRIIGDGTGGTTVVGGDGRADPYLPREPGTGKATFTKGRVEGADVWVDIDNDGELSAGDVYLGKTDANGQITVPGQYRASSLIGIFDDYDYTLSVSDAANGLTAGDRFVAPNPDAPEATRPVTATRTVTAMDTSTNSPVDGRSVTLPGDSSGDGAVASPLTTLVARMETEDGTVIRTAVEQQELLDEIFGKDLAGNSAVTVADILDAKNYNDFNSNTIGQLVETASRALAELAKSPGLTVDGAANDASPLDKLKALFKPYRDKVEDQTGGRGDRADNVAFDRDSTGQDQDLATGTLKDTVNRMSDSASGRPTNIDSEVNLGRPASTSEDDPHETPEIFPLLDGSQSQQQISAEQLFGFRDDLGNKNADFGISGVFIKAVTAGVNVRFADGLRQTAVHVQIETDRGIMDLAEARTLLGSEAGPQIGTAPNVANAPADLAEYVYVHWTNIQKLAFVSDENAHGEFEIEFYVYDGEEVARDSGTLRLHVSSVNDDPAAATLGGDRDFTQDDRSTRDEREDEMAARYVLSPEGQIIDPDGSIAGFLGAFDIESNLDDVRFSVAGTHGGLFEVVHPMSVSLDVYNSQALPGTDPTVYTVAVLEDANGNPVARSGSVRFEIVASVEGPETIPDPENPPGMIPDPANPGQMIPDPANPGGTLPNPDFAAAGTVKVKVATAGGVTTVTAIEGTPGTGTIQQLIDAIAANSAAATLVRVTAGQAVDATTALLGDGDSVGSAFSNPDGTLLLRGDGTPQLKLRDGAARITDGSSYSVTLVARDADGGEQRATIEIIQGGLYVGTGHSGRVYNDGSGLLYEEFNASTASLTPETVAAQQASLAIGNLVFTAVDAGSAGNANVVRLVRNTDAGAETEVVSVTDTGAGGKEITISYRTGDTLGAIRDAVADHAMGVDDTADAGDVVTVGFAAGATEASVANHGEAVAAALIAGDIHFWADTAGGAGNDIQIAFRSSSAVGATYDSARKIVTVSYSGSNLDQVVAAVNAAAVPITAAVAAGATGTSPFTPAIVTATNLAGGIDSGRATLPTPLHTATSEAPATAEIGPFTVTAKAAGLDGNAISVTFIGTGTGGTSSVEVRGGVNIEVTYDSGTSTLAEIKAAIDVHTEASAMVSVNIAIGLDGSETAYSPADGVQGSPGTADFDGITFTGIMNGTNYAIALNVATDRVLADGSIATDSHPLGATLGTNEVWVTFDTNTIQLNHQAGAVFTKQDVVDAVAAAVVRHSDSSANPPLATAALADGTGGTEAFDLNTAPTALTGGVATVIPNMPADGGAGGGSTPEVLATAAGATVASTLTLTADTAGAAANNFSVAVAAVADNAALMAAASHFDDAVAAMAVAGISFDAATNAFTIHYVTGSGADQDDAVAAFAAAKADSTDSIPDITAATTSGATALAMAAAVSFTGGADGVPATSGMQPTGGFGLEGGQDAVAAGGLAAALTGGADATTHQVVDFVANAVAATASHAGFDFTASATGAAGNATYTFTLVKHADLTTMPGYDADNPFTNPAMALAEYDAATRTFTIHHVDDGTTNSDGSTTSTTSVAELDSAFNNIADLPFTTFFTVLGTDLLNDVWGASLTVEVAFTGGADAHHRLDLGVLGFEGGVDAALGAEFAGHGVKEFYLTDSAPDNAAFEIVRVGDAQHLVFRGSDSGDRDAGDDHNLQIGIRVTGRDGALDATGNTTDADIRAFHLTGGEVTATAPTETAAATVSVAAGTADPVGDGTAFAWSAASDLNIAAGATHIVAVTGGGRTGRVRAVNDEQLDGLGAYYKLATLSAGSTMPETGTVDLGLGTLGDGGGVVVVSAVGENANGLTIRIVGSTVTDETDPNFVVAQGAVAFAWDEATNTLTATFGGAGVTVQTLVDALTANAAAVAGTTLTTTFTDTSGFEGEELLNQGTHILAGRDASPVYAVTANTASAVAIADATIAYTVNLANIDDNDLVANERPDGSGRDFIAGAAAEVTTSAVSFQATSSAYIFGLEFTPVANPDYNLGDFLFSIDAVAGGTDDQGNETAGITVDRLGAGTETDPYTYDVTLQLGTNLQFFTQSDIVRLISGAAAVEDTTDPLIPVTTSPALASVVTVSIVRQMALDAAARAAINLPDPTLLPPISPLPDNGSVTFVAGGTGTPGLDTNLRGFLSGMPGLFGDTARHHKAIGDTPQDQTAWRASHAFLDDGEDWWSYQGDYGTLVVRGNGYISYQLDPAASISADVEENFLIQVIDPGTGRTTLVNLTVPVNFGAKEQPDTASAGRLDLAAAYDHHVRVDENTKGRDTDAEGEPVDGTALFTFPYSDADDDTITYAITSVARPDGTPITVSDTARNPFYIDEETGVVRANLDLDHESGTGGSAWYVVTIEVTSTSTHAEDSDRGLPPEGELRAGTGVHRTETVVLVQINDLNEAPNDIRINTVAGGSADNDADIDGPGYMRDADGNLVLDDGGNRIPTGTLFVDLLETRDVGGITLAAVAPDVTLAGKSAEFRVIDLGLTFAKGAGHTGDLTVAFAAADETNLAGTAAFASDVATVYIDATTTGQGVLDALASVSQATATLNAGNDGTATIAAPGAPSLVGVSVEVLDSAVRAATYRVDGYIFTAKSPGVGGNVLTIATNFGPSFGTSYDPAGNTVTITQSTAASIQHFLDHINNDTETDPASADYIPFTVAIDPNPPGGASPLNPASPYAQITAGGFSGGAAAGSGSFNLGIAYDNGALTVTSLAGAEPSLDEVVAAINARNFQDAAANPLTASVAASAAGSAAFAGAAPVTDLGAAHARKVADLTVADDDTVDPYSAQSSWSVGGADAGSFEIRVTGNRGAELWLRPNARIPEPGENWNITLTVTDKAGATRTETLVLTNNGLYVTAPERDANSQVVEDAEGNEQTINIYTGGQGLLPDEIGLNDPASAGSPRVEMITSLNGVQIRAYNLGKVGHHLQGTWEWSVSVSGADAMAGDEFIIDATGTLYYAPGYASLGTGSQPDFEAADPQDRSFTVAISGDNTSNGVGVDRVYTYVVNVFNVNDESPEFTSPAAGVGATVLPVSQATLRNATLTLIPASATAPSDFGGIEVQFVQDSTLTGTATFSHFDLTFTRTATHTGDLTIVFAAADGTNAAGTAANVGASQVTVYIDATTTAQDVITALAGITDGARAVATLGAGTSGTTLIGAHNVGVSRAVDASGVRFAALVVNHAQGITLAQLEAALEASAVAGEIAPGATLTLSYTDAPGTALRLPPAGASPNFVEAGSRDYHVTGLSENIADGHVLFTVRSMDPDSAEDTIVYSLAVDGTNDNELFTIDAVTGEVRFAAGADYERGAGPDDNGVYNIVVTAANTASNLPGAIPDAGTLAATLAFRIEIANAEEAPTLIFMDVPAIVGTNTATSALKVEDEDLDGGESINVDGYVFRIGGNADGTGVDTGLFSVEAFDHDSDPTTADRYRLVFTGQESDRKPLGESYLVSVAVTDPGGQSFEQTVTIAEGSVTVTVAGEARYSNFLIGDPPAGLLPENGDGSGTPVAIGQISTATGATVTLATAGEVSGLPDSSLYDNAMFDITGGALSFTGTDSGDFEMKVGGTDNPPGFTIRVKVVSGAVTTYETYRINLSDVNDAPEFTTGPIDKTPFSPSSVIEVSDGGGTASVTEGNANNSTATGSLVVANAVGTVTFGGGTETASGTETFAGRFGDLVLNTSTGAWTYTLDPAAAALDEIVFGRSATENFLVSVTDAKGPGATDDETVHHAVTVTVNGSDVAVPAPALAVTNGATAPAREADLSVTEDNAEDNTASGTLSVASPVGTVTFGGGAAAGAGMESFTGRFGSLTLNTATGAWTYTADDDAAAFNQLGAGETATEVFAIAVTDDAGADPDINHTHRLEITVTGAGESGFTGVPIPIEESLIDPSTGAAPAGTPLNTVLLTEEMLPVSDQDRGDNDDRGPLGDFRYVVGEVFDGVIKVRLDVGSGFVDLATSGQTHGANHYFTLAQLRGGQVQFEHDGGEQFDVDADGNRTDTPSPAGFVVTIHDNEPDATDPDVWDGLQGETRRINLAVRSINDAPRQAQNNAISVTEGSLTDPTKGWHVITESDLFHTDRDDTRADLTYTVTIAAEHGSVQIQQGGVWSNLGLNATFTQQDIRDGNIRYHHDGSENATDSFSYSLADGGEDGARALTGRIDVAITLENEPPHTTIPAAGSGADDTANLLIAGLRKDHDAQGGQSVKPVGDNEIDRLSLDEGGHPAQRYTITANDMGLFDPDDTDDSTITITIATLPGATTGSTQYPSTAEYRLQKNIAGTWTDITANTTLTLAELKAGALRILPTIINNGPDGMPNTDDDVLNSVEPGDQPITFTYTYHDPARAGSPVGPVTVNVRPRPINDTPTAITLDVARIDPGVLAGQNIGVLQGDTASPVDTSQGVLTTSDEETTEQENFTYTILDNPLLTDPDTDFAGTSDGQYFEVFELDHDNNPATPARFALRFKTAAQLAQLGLVQKVAGQSYTIVLKVTDRGTDGTPDPAKQNEHFAREFVLPVRDFDVDWNHITNKPMIEAAPGSGDQAPVTYNLGVDTNNISLEFIVRPGTARAGDTYDVTPMAAGGNDFASSLTVAAGAKTAGDQGGQRFTVTLDPNQDSERLKALREGQTLDVNFNLLVTYLSETSDAVAFESQSVETFTVRFIGTNENPESIPQNEIFESRGAGATSAGRWGFRDPDTDDPIQNQGLLASAGTGVAPLAQNLVVYRGTAENPNTSYDPSASVEIQGDYGVLTIFAGDASDPSSSTAPWVYRTTDAVETAELGDATEVFNIQVSDVGGALSNVRTITINVKGQNDRPVLGLSNDPAQAALVAETDAGAIDAAADADKPANTLGITLTDAVDDDGIALHEFHDHAFGANNRDDQGTGDDVTATSNNPDSRVFNTDGSHDNMEAFNGRRGTVGLGREEAGGAGNEIGPVVDSLQKASGSLFANDIDRNAELRLFVNDADLGVIQTHAADGSRATPTGAGTITYHGLYGDLTFDVSSATGHFTWEYEVKARAEKIAHGETPVETFNLQIRDEHYQAGADASNSITLVIQVTGHNDAPIEIVDFTQLQNGVVEKSAAAVTESAFRTDGLDFTVNTANKANLGVPYYEAGAPGSGQTARDETTSPTGNPLPALRSNQNTARPNEAAITSRLDGATERFADTGANDVAGIPTASGRMDALDVDAVGTDGRPRSAEDQHVFEIVNANNGTTVQNFDGAGAIGGADLDGTNFLGSTISPDEYAAGTHGTAYTRQTGVYGTLELDKYTGEWTYYLDNTDADTIALNSGDVSGVAGVAAERFWIRVTDEWGAQVWRDFVVRVTGADDRAVLMIDSDSENGNQGSVDLEVLEASTVKGVTTRDARTGVTADGATASGVVRLYDDDDHTGTNDNIWHRISNSTTNAASYTGWATAGALRVVGLYGELQVDSVSGDTADWTYTLADGGTGVFTSTGAAADAATVRLDALDSAAVVTERFQLQIRSSGDVNPNAGLSNLVTLEIRVTGSNDGPTLEFATSNTALLTINEDSSLGTDLIHGNANDAPVTATSNNLDFGDPDSSDPNSGLTIRYFATSDSASGMTLGTRPTAPAAATDITGTDWTGDGTASQTRTITGEYGTFTLTRNNGADTEAPNHMGRISWTYQITDNLQSLDTGDNRWDVLHLQVIDNESAASLTREIVVQIQGVNDAPDRPTGAFTGVTNEDDDTLTTGGLLGGGSDKVTTGTINVVDVDANEAVAQIWAITATTANTSDAGGAVTKTTTFPTTNQTSPITVRGAYGDLTLTQQTGGASTTAWDWSYAVDTNTTAFDTLNASTSGAGNQRTLVETFSIAGWDGDARTIDANLATLTITIHGREDGPNIMPVAQTVAETADTGLVLTTAMLGYGHSSGTHIPASALARVRITEISSTTAGLTTTPEGDLASMQLRGTTSAPWATAGKHADGYWVFTAAQISGGLARLVPVDRAAPHNLTLAITVEDSASPPRTSNTNSNGDVATLAVTVNATNDAPTTITSTGAAANFASNIWTITSPNTGVTVSGNFAVTDADFEHSEANNSFTLALEGGLPAYANTAGVSKSGTTHTINGAGLTSGNWGVFELANTGAWSWQPNQSQYQALKAARNLDVRFHVDDDHSPAGRTTYQLRLVITGVEDPAFMSFGAAGTTTGTNAASTVGNDNIVTKEGSNTNDHDLVTGGTLRYGDPDTGDTVSLTGRATTTDGDGYTAPTSDTTWTESSPITGKYGRLHLTNDNVNGSSTWQYRMFTTSDTSFNLMPLLALETGMATETFEVRAVTDGGSNSALATLSITVNGAMNPNAAPTWTLGATTFGTINEADIVAATASTFTRAIVYSDADTDTQDTVMARLVAASGTNLEQSMSGGSPIEEWTLYTTWNGMRRDWGEFSIDRSGSTHMLVFTGDPAVLNGLGDGNNGTAGSSLLARIHVGSVDSRGLNSQSVSSAISLTITGQDDAPTRVYKELPSTGTQIAAERVTVRDTSDHTATGTFTVTDPDFNQNGGWTIEARENKGDSDNTDYHDLSSTTYDSGAAANSAAGHYSAMGVKGTYGWLKINATPTSVGDTVKTFTWTYTLDAMDTETMAVAAGGTVADEFDVRFDGATELISQVSGTTTTERLRITVDGGMDASPAPPEPDDRTGRIENGPDSQPAPAPDGQSAPAGDDAGSIEFDDGFDAQQDDDLAPLPTDFA